MTSRPPQAMPGTSEGARQEMELPEPRSTGTTSVEEAIDGRRSTRAFRPRGLILSQVSQLLWAAQGVTGPGGLRSAPSAGALHPLETFLVAGEVEGLPPGVYRYEPERHALRSMASGDRREPLARAALGQSWVAAAPAALVIAAEYSRTTGKYGERGRRYVHMEVGHAAQNVYLQAEALGMGTTMVGAFDERQVADVVGMASSEAAMGILPIGIP